MEVAAADPRMFRLLIARTQQVLASRAAVASSWGARVVGLLGRRSFSDDEALVIPRCRSIHTFGMRVPIDAVFVDRHWRVVAARTRLVPWRVTPPVWSAWAVVELPPGTLGRISLRVGDQLELVPSMNAR